MVIPLPRILIYTTSYLGVLLETKMRGDSPLVDWCFPLFVYTLPSFFFLPYLWSPSVYGFLTLFLSLFFFFNFFSTLSLCFFLPLYFGSLPLDSFLSLPFIGFHAAYLPRTMIRSGTLCFSRIGAPTVPPMLDSLL
jgi:hypothetical protein